VNKLQKYGAVASLTVVLSVGSNSGYKFNNPIENPNLPLVSMQVGQVARADGFDIANQYFKDSYSDIVGNLYSPWNKQVYMTELSENEVRTYRNQYRDRANGVMLNAAIERCISQYSYPWWMAARERTLARWTYAGREENGKFNLYRRMPSWNADKFMQLRGY
jgi:hypothetical protein